jgi:AraC-like DNA-binding protein
VLSLCFDLTWYETRYPYIRGISFMFRAGDEEKKGRFVCDMIRDYMIRLFFVQYHDMRTRNEICSDMADVMMAVLCRCFHNTDYLKIPLDKLKEIDVERLFSITGFVSKNYTRRELSVKDVAAAANLSASRVSHFWKEVINISLQQAIGMNRVHEAARLLLESDMPISEISERCGFSDEKYLYRRFKKTFGMTPNEYRRTNYLQHRDAGNFEFMNIRNEYALIRRYSVAHYTQLADFDFLKWYEDKLESETSILKLYGYVLREGSGEPANGIREQACGVFPMAPDMGLLYRDGAYSINWEYVYVAIFWFNELGLGVRIEMDYALMPEAQWELLMDELWSEIDRKWGARVTESMKWAIVSHSLEESARAWAFAEKMGPARGRDNVVTRFIL